MRVITEDSIESVLLQLENGDLNQALIFEDFKEKQYPFIQFIGSDNFKLLKDSEYELLLFNLLVLFFSINQSIDLPLIEAEQIELLDEKNWTVYNEEGSKHFSKVVDKYFNDYKQEDLLAYVEDSLAIEDEQILSQVGKEIIFITCKTFIDTLELN